MQINSEMNIIDILNNDSLPLEAKNYPVGLVSGKMGICIYYYYLSRWEENCVYEKIAESLLDNIISELSDTNDITVETGLAGVAIGISYLVKEHFINGDIDEILEDVDSFIFKRLTFLSYEDINQYISKSELLHLLYYLYMRYVESESSDNQYIFQELLIRTIEIFKEDLQANFFIEHFSFSLEKFHLPFFMYIFSKIYTLNIYNNRITKMFEEFSRYIIYTYPVSQANRLYLMCGLICIKPCLPNYRKEIEFRIQLLKKGINVEYIVNNELRNQDIYIMNGVSSVYLMLIYLQKKYPAYRIEFNSQLLFEKISYSNAWNSLISNGLYLKLYNKFFDGFPGAYLVMLHIKKHFL